MDTNTNEFPRETNHLLTQDEKNFLDDLPDAAVKSVLSIIDITDGRAVTLSFYPKDETKQATLHEFKTPERKLAVKDYYEMLFAYGVKDDPRD